ncbi:TPA: hypothetical protein NPN70_005447 [Klebsiella quasipneumoniae subsp. similipneumoniae]|nr:hypothetical protein [Klebsiella pneumoniae]HCI6115579.1 hypothetical protein [Klebsiella quasipneumoniae subsp. similipneumoniae]HCI6117918.1 hypothetical protein [Klebsiella quasipneumoniae subsp. similipneumoniae]HCI6454451.1 hypothetical protein [Klebsiella quasipneumoniae subsp. similipneumoniae]HCI6464199.1 hypothetical protein [Klebsiella quasipneumoniae subsp. similipneumoniae]
MKYHDPKLFHYVIATAWNENAKLCGHVLVALDEDYIDLTINKFPEHVKWIGVEPIKPDGPLGDLPQKVHSLEGSFTTREVPFDVIPGNGHQLYGC